MRSPLIVGDIGSASVVHGVHGTTGVSGWKCFTRRTGLSGDWEAVEWASLPPGGLSGEHVHTRTEELYFIISGHGRMLLDGRPHDVRAGDVILTGLGTRHGLRNVGSEELRWLVIEISAPATAAVLRGATT
ncbi:cupin domain-containing protein [Amycolatopsis cihanbeyliensis]|uniref:Cupin domain n=1 Tax=Amycolatopsis cihanbeyliensis TaxID=1128664 RepID=A0A542DIG9_AMYCI|nr:cupin domain-containing protein [Amycolatopsis cihanbeyliensis]TQJ02785.1 cupin domain [Amycolatopsis cihanbeyliensis]